ncbi:hypothetical protein EC973_007209 [Apophysomyces ossiformis]|uniref:Uncharacterized protein n=1 Tax=Apophysomyces ossiformis TaxID=679940 RepID=A0A8H7BY37_9FUNG|nr:hypothetical protein EC973_007209 [Apophysomyces ossiformis]
MFCEQLLDKITIMCNVYKPRNLSVLGRATFLNTLVLAQLWHVLRLLPAPKAFFLKIRSLAYRFVTHQQFPSVNLHTLLQPKLSGGLSILDPALQQEALQLRWIAPLFHPDHPKSFATEWFEYYICATTNLPNALFPLYFPSLRKPPLNSPLCASSLLLKTFDKLPFDWSRLEFLSPATCLLLPLQTTGDFSLMPSLSTSSTWRQLRVSDAYIFDGRLGLLRQRRRSERQKGINIISRRFLALQSLQQVIRSFFARIVTFPSHPDAHAWPDPGTVDPQPLCTALAFDFAPTGQRSLTARYRSLSQSQSPTNPLLLNPSHGEDFGDLISNTGLEPFGIAYSTAAFRTGRSFITSLLPDILPTFAPPACRAPIIWSISSGLAPRNGRYGQHFGKPTLYSSPQLILSAIASFPSNSQPTLQTFNPLKSSAVPLSPSGTPTGASYLTKFYNLSPDRPKGLVALLHLCGRESPPFIE